MPEEITNPDDSLAEGVDVTPADGEGTETSNVSKILNETLGKEFKDDESALTAVKETFKTVSEAAMYKNAMKDYAKSHGISVDEAVKHLRENLPDPSKVDESTNTNIDTSKFVSKDEFDKANFYAQNPDYKDYADLVDSLSTATGKSRAEVVQSDAFKSVFEKATAYDKLENSKSVLVSNPRLGQVTDKITKAKEAIVASKQSLSGGDTVSSQKQFDDAAHTAVEAVIEAYDV